MALPHALPLETIDVRPLGPALKDAVTTSLQKTPRLQLMRLVLPAGRIVPEHHVPGAITVHCLEGEAILTTPSHSCRLEAGRLVMLEGGEPHGLQAVTDATLLVTLVLRPA